MIKACIFDLDGTLAYTLDSMAAVGNMEEYEIEGTELMARAMCHEIDHLDGHLYVEKVEGQLHDVTYEEEE